MRIWGCAIAGLMVGAFPGVAFAQDQAQPAAAAPAQAEPSDDPQDAPEDIVVRGELRGAVPGDIPPEQSLTQADIRAYGASTVSELLDALSPQTSSGRGRGGERPVVLLNGRRISSFREIRDTPTEAIERVDILPEEVALKFGYSADQRVVNIVLRERFRAWTGEVQAGAPTAGGNATGQAQADLLRIRRDKRLNLDLKVQGSSGLLESERGIVSPNTSLFDPRGNVGGVGGGELDPALSAMAGAAVTTAGVPGSATLGAPSLAAFVPTANQPYAADVTPYRTLVSPSRSFTLNSVYSRNLSNKIAGTLNAEVESTHRTSLLGLNTLQLTLPETDPYSPFANDVLLYRGMDSLGPLGRTSDSLSLHGGGSLNGDGLPWSKDWRWSFTGNYDRTVTDSDSQTGLDPAPVQALLGAGNAGFNPFGPIGPTLLQRRPNDTAHSVSSTGSVSGLLNGPLFKVPAGNASTSLRFEGSTADFNSRSLRGGIARTSENARDRASVKANFDLPIASRRRGVLDAIGDLTLNGNVEVEQLSDFGTLVTTGYGVNWSPIKEVRLVASVTDEEGAPSANQLGDPTISTPNTRVFDYVRGESVNVTTISGGNPLLTSDSRHVLKLGINLRPLEDTDLNFRADYVSSTTRNQISGFPGATAEVEAAFPGRFVRDPGGNLLSIDTRPVNFDSAERKQMTWGFNFSMPLKSSLETRVRRAMEQYRDAREEAARTGAPTPPLPAELQRMREMAQAARGGGRRRPDGQGGQGGQGRGARDGEAPANQQAAQGTPPVDGPPREGPPQTAANDAPPGGPPPGAGRFGGGGRGPGGFGGGGGRGGFGGANGAMAGRLIFTLFHTWTFKDQIRIRSGLPILDRLNGAAAGNSGGTPEHTIDGRATFSKDGVKIGVAAKWKSATEVNTGALGSVTQLNFGSLATFDLNAQIDLGRQLNLLRKHRWLRGTQVTLSIDNLFDQRQRVTDATGTVPLSYQPGLIDPTGRAVKLTIRKLFY